MTTPSQTASKAPSTRKISLAAGILYLLTFISIPTLWLYRPIHDPSYILGHGPDTAVAMGGVLEMFMALACIGTAVALYPVIKKQNEAVALGLVGARILEAGAIFADVFALMAVVSLRKAGVGSEALVTGQALVALYDWFRLAQNFMPGINALLLGYLLYKSRLVPRILPTLGFIGAPLLIANTILTLFGVTGLPFTLTGIGVLPIALWEFSLGIWLTVKGFNSSAVSSLYERTSSEPVISAAS